jgi:hypothetical protein
MNPIEPVLIDGVEFRFGNRPGPRLPSGVGDGSDLVPEPEWVEFSHWDDGLAAVLHPLNQNPHGACCPHAGVESLMGMTWLAGGTLVPLSPWWLYGTLSGGWDAGASISECLQVLTQKGAPRDELVRWGDFDPRHFTQAMADDAAKHRVEVGGPVRSFAAIMSHAQRGHLMNVSLDGSAMARYGTDRYGRCRGLGGPNNDHALSLGYEAKRFDGKWYVGGLNHWANMDWGLKQRFYVCADDFSFASWSYDGYYLDSPVDTPGDSRNPPAVP